MGLAQDLNGEPGVVGSFVARKAKHLGGKRSCYSEDQEALGGYGFGLIYPMRDDSQSLANEYQPDFAQMEQGLARLRTGVAPWRDSHTMCLHPILNHILKEREKISADLGISSWTNMNNTTFDVIKSLVCRLEYLENQRLLTPCIDDPDCLSVQILADASQIFRRV